MVDFAKIEQILMAIEEQQKIYNQQPLEEKFRTSKKEIIVPGERQPIVYDGQGNIDPKNSGFDPSIIKRFSYSLNNGFIPEQTLTPEQYIQERIVFPDIRDIAPKEKNLLPFRL